MKDKHLLIPIMRLVLFSITSFLITFIGWLITIILSMFLFIYFLFELFISFVLVPAIFSLALLLNIKGMEQFNDPLNMLNIPILLVILALVSVPLQRFLKGKLFLIHRKIMIFIFTFSFTFLCWVLYFIKLDIGVN